MSIIDFNEWKKDRKKKKAYTTQTSTNKSTTTSITLPDDTDTYRSCSTCTHHYRTSSGRNVCGHFPDAVFHEVNTKICYPGNRALWHLKEKNTMLHTLLIGQGLLGKISVIVLIGIFTLLAFSHL